MLSFKKAKNGPVDVAPILASLDRFENDYASAEKQNDLFARTTMLVSLSCAIKKEQERIEALKTAHIFSATRKGFLWSAAGIGVCAVGAVAAFTLLPVEPLYTVIKMAFAAPVVAGVVVCDLVNDHMQEKSAGSWRDLMQAADDRFQALSHKAAAELTRIRDIEQKKFDDRLAQKMTAAVTANFQSVFGASAPVQVKVTLDR
jgi:hypothetical protein